MRDITDRYGTPGAWAYFVTVHFAFGCWLVGRFTVEPALTRALYLVMIFSGTYALVSLLKKAYGK